MINSTCLYLIADNCSITANLTVVLFLFANGFYVLKNNMYILSV